VGCRDPMAFVLEPSPRRQVDGIQADPRSAFDDKKLSHDESLQPK
jgi:hypothetical protein